MRALLAILIFLPFIVGVQQQSAPVLYVAPYGTANAVGDVDHPRTLASMLCTGCVSPGTLVYLIPGTYSGDFRALPNAAAEAAGGLYTRGTGAGQIRQDANGRVDVNAKAWIDGAIPAVNVTGVPKVDVVDWLGSAPDALSSGKVPADIKLWLTAAPAALTTNGYVQAMLLRWLTDNAAGTPNALTSGRVDSIVGAYASGQAPLQPTVSGRTLDVTTTGEAGVDWANVGSPSSTNNLSGTTIGTLTTNSDKTGYRLSATGVDDVWDEAQSGHTTAGTFGKYLDVEVSSRLATSGYTAPPSAATIAAAVWDYLASAATTVGSLGKRIADFLTGDAFARLGAPTGASVSADIALVQADTDNIQTRLPAALVSGRMDSSVGAMATDTLTSAALAASAVTEIQTGLSTLTAAQVNTEVVDALSVDTYAESGSVPAATNTIAVMLHWLFTLARNKRTTTATADNLRNDGDSATIGTSVLSDDGTTFTRGKYT